MRFQSPLLLFTLFFCTGLVNLSGQVRFTMEDQSIEPGTSFCQEFVVEDFQDIVTMQFSINWNPAILRFDSVVGLNIPEPQMFQFNQALAANGQLPINWLDPIGGGLSVSDGTSLFSLCFTAIGNTQQCTNLEFTNLPLSIDVTDVNSNGQNIGLVAPVAMICVVNPLSLFRANITTGDCNNPDGNGVTLILRGGTFPYTYTWSGPNGFTGSSPVLTGLENGDYFVTITDASVPPLTLIDTFEVYGDFTPPDVVINQPEKLDCDTDQLTIDAGNSSLGMEFSYQWNTSSGNIISGENSLNPVIDAGGWYQLIISNSANGCTAEDRVQIEVDTLAPIAQAIADGILTCTDSIIDLNAAGSSSGPAITYQWTTIGGNILGGVDSLQAQVNAGGNYLLLVRNTENACETTVGVVVEENTLQPLAEAGSAEVDCDSLRVFLNVNNAAGAVLEYAWLTQDGTITAGDSTERPQIGQGGTYQLLVLDPENGCVNTSELTVANSLFPLPAVAGENQVSCFSDATITAVLPDNALGEWTGESSALIADMLDDTTTVSNLAPGQNLFIWTLSTNECTDYSSDTLSIWMESAPLTNNDTLVLPFGVPSVTLNVALNDSTQLLGGWDIAITAEPDLGTLENRGLGLFEISYPAGSQGNTTFGYQICNTLCPSFCDEATVFLSFQMNPNIDTTVHIANGITPNGDGVNEMLIVPELEEDPTAYPDNELVIFNRWGDVVYRAQPYLNDWQGTDMSGEELPQGTYYYVMTLEFGSAKIFKGDVTILK